MIREFLITIAVISALIAIALYFVLAWWWPI
jgi:hypothetical protein